MLQFLAGVLAPTQYVFIGLAIFVVVSQGPKGEGLLQQLHDTQVFSSFRQTKIFLRILTWTSILGFMVVQYVLALAQC